MRLDRPVLFRWPRSIAAALLLVVVGLAGCGQPIEGLDDDELLRPTESDNFWVAGDAGEPPELGKADAVLAKRALSTQADGQDTAVWTVSRQWSQTIDVDFAPYFRKADRITWRQAYQRFVDGLEAQPGVEGYRTYKIRNPWGKELPIAALECAEQSIFLRATFAAWFRLPFFMEAIDGTGTRVFAGHFGFRTLTGRYRNFNLFKQMYRDDSATARAAAWPQDAALRRKSLGSDDNQSFLAAGATFGRYLDELHANKRAGHFTLMLLAWFGSVNMADPANTFHVVPEGVRSGDILLERWQREGIGHALIVKEVQPGSRAGKLSVELASGSMPRRQAKWETPFASRRYFMSEETGGSATNYEGVPYVRFGGGLRRWREAQVYSGAWVNVVPTDSRADWIDSTDQARLGARPQRFAQILEEGDPNRARQELMQSLSDARAYLRNVPASCGARTRRESVIDALVSLEMAERGMSAQQAERMYRSVEDWLYPAVVYERSRTCCFNSSTPAMHQIVWANYQAELAATRQCRAPTAFVSRAGGYEPFVSRAAQMGRSADWVAWRADEPCPQARTSDDQLDPVAQAMNYCDFAPR